MIETKEKIRRVERKGVATLAEVAKLAGVSEITVSRIIRNSGPISDKTRQRVTEAINRIGYVPNRVAGSLASAGSNLIGVVIPSLSNIVFPEVLRGLNAGLRETAFQQVVGVTDYDMQAEENLVGSLLAWRPAAIVIAGFDHTEPTRRMLDHSGVRIAELMDIDAAPIDIAVGLSHRRAGYDTGRYLIQRGFRRFGYVGHDRSADRRAHMRYIGLREALRDGGSSITAETIVDGPSSTAAGRSLLEDLLARGPAIDIAVFSNDDMAVGGVFHCISAGITLKTQLGIFGFNGLDIGQSLPVPLSTIRSNRFLIGKIAVEKILESRTRPKEPIVVDTGYEILEGGTA